MMIRMRSAAFLLPALILLQSDACDQKNASSPSPAKHFLTRPAHRFENVSSTGNLGVALDTMTGRWCRTWDWNYIGKPDANGLNTLPTCYELFTSEPAEVEATK
jgi:hypothetical protein